MQLTSPEIFFIFCIRVHFEFPHMKMKRKRCLPGLFSRYQLSKSSNFEAKMHCRQRKTSFSNTCSGHLVEIVCKIHQNLLQKTDFFKDNL